MKRVLVFVASTLVLSACSKVNLPIPFMRGAERMAVGPLAPPTPATDAYLRAAGESDLYEVTSSQLAIQRTQNPDVRRFATRMIDHHTGTTNALLAAARTASIAPPPVVLAGQRRAMIDQLNGQTGRNFDRLYIQQQVAAHQEALAVHASYAQSGDTPPIRSTAAAAIPMVQAHLAQAQRMHARMGAMTSGM